MMLDLFDKHFRTPEDPPSVRIVDVPAEEFYGEGQYRRAVGRFRVRVAPTIRTRQLPAAWLTPSNYDCLQGKATRIVTGVLQTSAKPRGY